MNGVLVVNKPSGPTSHDIVDLVRRAARMKKVGHTGTLDPMATGVLVLTLGRATRIARFLELEPKAYLAEATFGIATDTQDITGNIVQRRTGTVSVDEIRQALPRFTGEILQVPPMVSAVKVKGTPLYKMARLGKEVEREPRRVTVYDFKLIEVFEVAGEQKAFFSVLCSGGTYVRTLIHDLGEQLGVGATLSILRRTKVGRFSIQDALGTDEIEDDPSSIERHLLSIDEALSHMPEATVRDEAVPGVLNGGRVDASKLAATPEGAMERDPVRVKSRSGTLLAIGRIVDSESYTIAPEIVFN